LKILNNEVPVKYPAGSTVYFLSDNIDHNFPNNVALTYSCVYYDKVGGKHPSNKVERPPKWQHLTEDEKNEIIAMFDDPLVIEIVRT